MHTRWIIWKLVKAQIDIEKFLELIPENDGKDYESLGLPSQALTSYLKNEGIIKKLRIENRANQAGNKTKHVIWGRGRCFGSFKEYWQKNYTKFTTTPACQAECCQAVVV